MLVANFTFLLDKPEYSSFAQACIQAENIWKDSPSSCVSGCRTALENMIKWVYQKDNRLSYVHTIGSDGKRSTDLFDRMESESFRSIMPDGVHRGITNLRRLANKVLHENFPVSSDDAMRCLSDLFYFLAWLDRTYGTNHVPRAFSKERVPTNPSTLMTVLKYAGAAVGGAAALVLAAVLSGDNNKKTS